MLWFLLVMREEFSFFFFFFKNSSTSSCNSIKTKFLHRKIKDKHYPSILYYVIYKSLFSDRIFNFFAIKYLTIPFPPPPVQSKFSGEVVTPHLRAYGGGGGGGNQ